MILNPFFSIKSIDTDQWYWSYEYPEFNNIEFDSYILNYKQIGNDERYQKISLKY